MYHSITIGDKNTWEDWHLIPSSRPFVAIPSVRTKTVEVPGADGKLDMTTILTGEPLYDNRMGEWEFYIDHDQWYWVTAITTISEYLHGREYQCILEDDPGYYYVGRFSVNSFKSNKAWSTISIHYELKPFKYSVLSSADAEDWEWDPFSFETGIIRENTSGITVSGEERTITIEGKGHRAVPTIVVSGLSGTNKMSVTVSNGTYLQQVHLGNGTHRPVGFYIQNGSNTITFDGNGTVTVRYVEERF